MNIKVKNCNDCPLLSVDGYDGEESYCWIKKEWDKLLNNGVFGEVEKIPDWCPLKKENITIELL